MSGNTGEGQHRKKYQVWSEGMKRVYKGFAMEGGLGALVFQLNWGGGNPSKKTYLLEVDVKYERTIPL